MGANITGYLPVVGFFRRPTVLEFKSKTSPQERRSSKKQVPAGAEIDRLNAYKVAVLLVVGATILSVL